MCAEKCIVGVMGADLAYGSMSDPGNSDDAPVITVSIASWMLRFNMKLGSDFLYPMEGREYQARLCLKTGYYLAKAKSPPNQRIVVDCLDDKRASISL
jgi:hypothetical protein